MRRVRCCVQELCEESLAGIQEVEGEVDTVHSRVVRTRVCRFIRWRAVYRENFAVLGEPDVGTIRLRKILAAEMPLEQRVYFPELPDAVAVSHNEEHLVLELPETKGELPETKGISVGDVLLGYPKHICPTVALHAKAVLVSQGTATGQTWCVAARDR